jgi:hypothetical protein
MFVTVKRSIDPYSEERQMMSPHLVEEMIRQHHEDLTAAAVASRAASRRAGTAPSVRLRRWLGAGLVSLGERLEPEARTVASTCR